VNVPQKKGLWRGRSRLEKGAWVFLAVVVVAAVAAVVTPSDDNASTSSSGVRLLPEVSAFLENHTEFGSAVATDDVPDWAQGKRQRVRFESGRRLLFYTKTGSVVTVYEDQPGEGRVKVWGEYDEPVESAPEVRQAETGLPAYTVLSAIDSLAGGRFGDVLAPSVSRATPVADRETIARRIAAKEKFTNLSLYSIEDAYKANLSSTFASKHPNAMREGFLGMLEDGKFTAGEAFYP
jgi:hypothetical protein